MPVVKNMLLDKVSWSKVDCLLVVLRGSFSPLFVQACVYTRSKLRRSLATGRRSLSYVESSERSALYCRHATSFHPKLKATHRISLVSQDLLVSKIDRLTILHAHVHALTNFGRVCVYKMSVPIKNR